MSLKDLNPISDIGKAEIAISHRKPISLLPYLINRNIPKAEAYTGKVPVSSSSRN
jgi:hypothetical protein